MHQRIDGHFDDVVEDLTRMVAHASDASLYAPEADHPFGREMTATLDAFLDLAKGYGFATTKLDNIVGYVDSSTDGTLPLYGIMCHLDVVPAGDRSAWKTPPYEATVIGNRLYGRGSFDDKGPAVAALHAMRHFVAGRKPACRFRLIVGIDEETGLFRCMKRYLLTEEVPVASFSPDGAFPLINAEKGILRLTVSKDFGANVAPGAIASIAGGVRTNVVPASALAVVRGVMPEPVKGIAVDGQNVTAAGRATHVKVPWEGENAILLLLEYLAGVGDTAPLGQYLAALYGLFRREYTGASLGIASSDEPSGELTCSLSVIHGDEKGVTLKIDIRHPVTVDGDAIVARLSDVFGRLGASVTLDSRNYPLYVPADDPFVKLLLSGYEAVTGEKGVPHGTGGGTYCRDMPHSVSFGILFPGEDSVAHCPNEYVNLDSLKKAVHIYAEVMERINSKG